MKLLHSVGSVSTSVTFWLSLNLVLRIKKTLPNGLFTDSEKVQQSSRFKNIFASFEIGNDSIDDPDQEMESFDNVQMVVFLSRNFLM